MPMGFQGSLSFYLASLGFFEFSFGLFKSKHFMGIHCCLSFLFDDSKFVFVFLILFIKQLGGNSPKIKDDAGGDDKITAFGYIMMILRDSDFKLAPLLKSLPNLVMGYLSLRLEIQDHFRAVILDWNLRTKKIGISIYY